MACEECTRNCQMAHWNKKDLSPSVYRFFKVVFGNDVSEVLCLPPKFARTISHMDGKETKLEDSTGAQWTVTLSKHKGILAFRNGWAKFAADHKLQIGEFLVVNYLKNGHFVVHIFEHSCSERTEFGYKILPEKCTMSTEKITSEQQLCKRNATNAENFKVFGHPNKKARVSRNIVKAYTSSETSDDTNREFSSPSVPVESNLETKSNHQLSTKDDPLKHKSCNEEKPYLDDACCVIMDRGSCYAETEKKNVLYDLSVFEKQKSECFAGKRCSDGEEDTHTHAQENVASMAEARTGFICKMPVTKVPDTKVPDTVHTMGAHDIIKSVKKELVTLREEASDHNQNLQDLKPSLIREVGSPSKSRFKRKAEELELDDSVDEPNSNPDSISCLAETDNRDFIVLPARLPCVKFKLGKGKRDYKCSMLLQDPKKRKWPAIYYEKSGVFVLICGWKQFNEANKVRLGDRYNISPKNESPCEYMVNVDRM